MANPKIQRLYEQLVSGERSGDLFKDETLAGEYDKNTSVVFGSDLKDYEEGTDFLLNLTSYSPSDTIVDMGCGTGISTLRLLQRNPRRVVGLDFSEPMLQQAREKMKDRDNVEFRVASAEELSDVISDADKVVSANVFQYISDPDAVLRGIYKALNPNGKYLFNVKVKAPREQSIYFQFFRILEGILSKEFGKEVHLPELKGFEPKYNRASLEELASRNGFTVARYEERPIIYKEEHLRATYEQMLTAMASELQTSIGEERTTTIVGKVKERLEPIYSANEFVAGTEAYICLRKTPAPK